LNALQVDPATGFLEHGGPSNYGFTADKKVQFLELAKAFRIENKFPNVSLICDQIGVDIRSFERHIAVDEPFKQAWQEISTHVEYQCISDMSELRRKNPMYMFGLLRYLNPKRWNPNEKPETAININVFSEAIKELPRYKDAEIVDTSPAIAPRQLELPSENDILTKDLSTVDLNGGQEIPPPPPPDQCKSPPPTATHKKPGKKFPEKKL
jgi:hypothetical protein